jgi:rhodanese-related sulfurtransferase
MVVKFKVPSFAAAMLFAIAACAAAAEHTTDSLDTVKKHVSEKKAVLVDVREEGEWKQGHIEGAKLLPLSELEETKSAESLKRQLPADKIIYVHCYSGVRSLAAADILSQHGFEIRPLKPGYKELLKAGFKKAEK